MLRKIMNQKGNSIMASMMLMMVMAASAAAVVNISGSDSRQYTDNMQATQALAVGNGGIQWALDRLKRGLSPDVTDKELAPGTFTVVSNAGASLVNVTSMVGNAKKIQSVNADFSKDCVTLDTAGAYLDGDSLNNVKLISSCNTPIVTKITMTWNWSQCATNLGCDGNELVEEQETIYEDVGNPPNNKFWICHVPPGNPENRHSIAVNVNGWNNGHSGGNGSHNMDYLGPCIISEAGEDDEVVIQTCAATPASSTALSLCISDDGGAALTEIRLSETIIFQDGEVPNANSEATSSGEETDVADAMLSQLGSYNLKFIHDHEVPMGAWYTVRVDFADGSQLTDQFKVGDPANQPQGGGAGDDGDVQPDPIEEEGFEVDNGVVIIEANQQIDLQVLGSEITCGAGGPEISVKTKLCVNSSCTNLWNYQDVDGGETYSTTNSIEGAEYKIFAQAIKNNCINYSVDSTNTAQVRTLKNGDQAPALAGFGGQQPVENFLAPYLSENGTIVLNSNQVIMLFELGVDMNLNPNSLAADFQDLVILMTITDEPQ